jgi:hypothetical protein
MPWAIEWRASHKAAAQPRIGNHVSRDSSKLLTTKKGWEIGFGSSDSLEHGRREERREEWKREKRLRGSGSQLKKK